MFLKRFPSRNDTGFSYLEDAFVHNSFDVVAGRTALISERVFFLQIYKSLQLYEFQSHKCLLGKHKKNSQWRMMDMSLHKLLWWPKRTRLSWAKQLEQPWNHEIEVMSWLEDGEGRCRGYSSLKEKDLCLQVVLNELHTAGVRFLDLWDYFYGQY